MELFHKISLEGFCVKPWDYRIGDKPITLVITITHLPWAIGTHCYNRYDPEVLHPLEK